MSEGTVHEGWGQAVVLICLDLLRVVLVPGKILPGGIVISPLGNGDTQLSGWVGLAD